MRSVVIPPVVSSDLPPLDASLLRLQGATMGTTWSVLVAAAPSTDEGAMRGFVQQRLELVVGEMSHWEPDSDLGRFNCAQAGTWRSLPESFFYVLAYGLLVAEESAGAFNPATGALVDLWGFGPSGRYDEPGFSPPSNEVIEAALARSDWRMLKLDHDTHGAMQPGGMRLDLSAIAKGYAVDAVAYELERHGIAHYLVEVGGELRGAGMKPDGQPWWVLLEQPASGAMAGGGEREILAALHGMSVATSGDYRKYFTRNGKVFPHTIDPRSGRPIDNGVASVTVLHERCMEADALSTALTVLGPVEGMRFAEQKRIAARFLVRTPGGFEERLSSAFRDMLE